MNNKAMYNANNPYNPNSLPNYPYPQYPPNAYQAGRPRRRWRLGCLMGFLVLVGALTALGTFIYQRFLAHLLPFTINPILAGLALAIAASVVLTIAFALTVLNWLGSRRVGGRPRSCLGSIVGSVFSLGIVAGVIVLAFYGFRLAYPEVDMTRASFVQASVDASSGAQVRFVNPSNGVEQVLCVGFEQRCTATGGDPAALDGQGLRIEPGQTVTVVFDNFGDYQITSKTTPHMNTTIHVHEDSGGD